jgi:hypothetical protein
VVQISNRHYHELAWNVVQEFGHIINYLSINEKLPAMFFPSSAPPYMNGGPDDHLCWIIESVKAAFSPDDLQKWLEARLPSPVENLKEWNTED